MKSGPHGPLFFVYFLCVKSVAKKVLLPLSILILVFVVLGVAASHIAMEPVHTAEVTTELNRNALFEGETQVVALKPMTSSLGDRITFTEQSANRNSDIEVRVNGVNAGTFSGQAISQSSFSPNSTYLSFKVRNVCGADCISYDLVVIRINEPKVILLPKIPMIENDRKSNAGEPYISTYAWSANDELSIRASYITFEGNKVYLLTPLKDFVFNIRVGKYE